MGKSLLLLEGQFSIASIPARSLSFIGLFIGFTIKLYIPDFLLQVGQYLIGTLYSICNVGCSMIAEESVYGC